MAKIGRAALTFGIIGPSDLVPHVAELASSIPDLTARELAYGSEQETVELIRSYGDEVDGWLFTGVVPHEIAKAADVLRQPAEHVSYSGVTLLGALFRLHREGRDVSLASVDTLHRDEVAETVAEAGLLGDSIKTMPYEPHVRSEDLVEFHRRARANDGTTVAITCLRSAYDVLVEEMPVVRLAPSVRDIREAIDALILKARDRMHSDAQVALGFVELDANGESADTAGGLERDLAELGGAVVRIDGERYLIVTTRGPLERATAGFSAAPFLDRIAGRHRSVHAGLGLGRSAGEAAAHASRALARARARGAVAAVLSTHHDADIVLNRDTAVEQTPLDLAQLAGRVGMSRATLQSLRRVAHTDAERTVTATQIATAFSIQERSARRLLKRLERAGAAVPVGTLSAGQMGRPPVIYRLDI